MNRFLTLLKGRARRGEYWIFTGVMLVVSIALNLAFHSPLLASLPFPVWLYAAIRRLHDMGRSGWWSLTPAGAGFVTGAVVGFAGGVGAPLAPNAMMMQTAFINLLSVVFIIGVGAWPGTPAATNLARLRVSPMTSLRCSEPG